MSGRLKDEVALVTGASRGFGERIALALASEGAAVALVARSKDEIEAHAARIESEGGRAVALTGDVTDPDDVARVVAAARERLGPITILVNNAGVGGPFGPLGVVDVETWWRTEEIHVRAPLLFMSAVIPEMRRLKRGRIINVASIGGRMIRYAMSAYGVSKCAEIELSKFVAAEGAADGIVCFSIQPGLAHTGIAEATLASPEAQKWAPHMIETVKQRRRDAPDPEPAMRRCAEMCVGLASGDYDVLSGRFLLPEDDFDALAAEAAAG